MLIFQFEQHLGKLPPRQGAYTYLEVEKSVIDQFPKQRATRLICRIDEKVEYGCGLSHLGNGNYFIIVANKWLKKLGKVEGDRVFFKIWADPNPLGVEVPEVLSELLKQDKWAKSVYDQITDGKKRSLIYTILRLKNIDKQVANALDFFKKEETKFQKK
ncbi:MAG: DUF1905 domain-containing protein [Bacteroidota bacterium]